MVFDRFDHYIVLQVGTGDLHAAGVADSGMRNIAISGDFVAGINDNNPFVQIVSQYPGGLAQQGGFTNTGFTNQQDTLAAFHQILNYTDSAIDRPADPAGQANRFPGSVTDDRDTVQSAFDPGPVIASKSANILNDMLDVGVRDFALAENDLAVAEAGFRLAAQVHHHFQKLGATPQTFQRLANVERQRRQKQFQVIG